MASTMTNIMKIIYARQSLDKKDSISIESQIEHCKSQILPEEKDSVIIIKDKGYSGKNTQRPGFEKMMNYIKRGVVTQVIVYKLDRISRSLLDFAEMMSVFSSYGVDFISATEKFDTSSPTGRAMISIIMVFAQLERETIQQRITDNYYARGKLGMFLGGTAAYGFLKRNTLLNGKKTSELIFNDMTIGNVMRMFQEYAYTDVSLGQIAGALNLAGIPSPKGAPWDNSKISRILRNPVYVMADVDVYNYYKAKGCQIENNMDEFIGTNGCFLYGKRTQNERKYTDVTDHRLSLGLHKGAIDSKTFLICQHKLDRNKQLKKSGAGKKTWLSGIIRCAYCGYAMSVSEQSYVGIQREKPRFLIVCGGRKLHIPCERKKLSYDMTVIEKYVETELKNIISKMKDMNYETDLLTKKTTQEENIYKIEIEKIEGQIDSLIENLSLGNELTSKYINAKIKQLDTKKNEILKALNELRMSSVQEDKIVEISRLADNWDELEFDDKKLVAKYFIKSVKFYDTEVKIEWNLMQ